MTKVIAVAGGKGGTGKTFITVNLIEILRLKGKRLLLLDADVENPSTHTILNYKVTRSVEVKSFKPVIDMDKCKKCGLCVKECPEHALVLVPPDKLLYVESLCAGCRVCQLVCPTGAIGYSERVEGVFKYGVLDDRVDVIAGELKPGNRRSAVLITRLLETHKKMFKEYDYVVIDSPPGSGVGLFSIIKYATHVIAVTEPTPLGVNDLRKFLTLIDKFKDVKRKILVVINKYGIPGGCYEELELLLKSRLLPHVKIPYSELVVKSYLMGKPLVKMYPDSDVAKAISEIVNFVK